MIVSQVVKDEIVDMYFDCVNTIKLEIQQQKEKEREEVESKKKKIEINFGDKLLSLFSKTPNLNKNASVLEISKSPDIKHEDNKVEKAKTMSFISGAQKDSFAEVTDFSKSLPPVEESKYSTSLDQKDEFKIEGARPSAFTMNQIENKDDTNKSTEKGTSPKTEK